VSEQKFLPLDHRMYSENEMCQRATEFYAEIKTRRTVRDFSDRPVPKVVIEGAIRAAGTSPSGANQQPWHFAVITDRNLKRQIREALRKRNWHFTKTVRQMNG
jgi:nitroreductase